MVGYCSGWGEEVVSRWRWVLQWRPGGTLTLTLTLTPTPTPTPTLTPTPSLALTPTLTLTLTPTFTKDPPQARRQWSRRSFRTTLVA